MSVSLLFGGLALTVVTMRQEEIVEEIDQVYLE